MKRKDILVFQYKVVELKLKNGLPVQREQPEVDPEDNKVDWESMGLNKDGSPMSDKDYDKDDEDDSEGSKQNPLNLLGKYDASVFYRKKTFDRNDIFSIEESDENSTILVTDEGSFKVKGKFKKVFKLVYKK